MPLTIEEQLKREILDQYRSVRAFTQVIGLPYSTVDNIFKRGINGTAVITVARVFRALGLDMDSIGRSTLRRQGEPSGPPAVLTEEEQHLEQLADNYRVMNEEGRGWPARRNRFSGWAPGAILGIPLFCRYFPACRLLKEEKDER